MKMNPGRIYYLIILPVFIASCSNNSGSYSENIKTSYDSVYRKGNDSIIQNPAYVKKLAASEMNQINDSNEYYRFAYLYASACFRLTQFDTAYIMSDRILSFCKRQGKPKQLDEITAMTHNLIGNYYINMFMPDSAETHYKMASTYFLSEKDYSSVINVYINIADASISKGDYPYGVHWYRKAMLLADSLKISDFYFPIYSGLGRAYLDLRDFEQSEHFYQSAEKTYNKQNFLDQYIYCNNRGNLYYFQKQYDKALPWFRKALDLVTPGGYDFHIQLCGLNLADTYLRLGKLDSASYFAERGNEYFSKLDNASTIYYNRAIRAGIAMEYGRMVDAKQLFKQTNNHSGVNEDLVSIRNRLYVEYCLKIGDYRQACTHLLKNEFIDDSLRANIAHKRAATYDMQYKLDTSLIRKDVFIAQQKYDINRERKKGYLLLINALFVVLLSVIIILWLRKKRDLQVLQYQDKLNQSRIQNIRNRISPHFIFNVLNGITNQSIEDERRNILIKLLRDSLIMADEKSITLNQELDFVKSYIELEKPNLGEQFSLDWNVNPQLELDKIKIPPLLIQIPVENAIKHGLKPKNGEKKLIISLLKEEKGIRIIVKDNGAGIDFDYFLITGKEIIPRKKISSSTGTGMKVMQETIRYVNTKNTVPISFNVYRLKNGEEQGTIVELFIPDGLKLER
jgi:tetratricopeptide (TPR) repeat protein